MTSVPKHQLSSNLMIAYAAGNIEAFNELYSLHKGALYRFILRQGIVTSRAEELFQEIWLKVIKARNNYQVTARFQTWLYRIARNHLIDDYRKHSKIENIEYDEALENEAEPNEALSNLDKDLLLTLVAKLPFEQRQALILKHEAGFSNEDIAEITETNQETVKSRIRYAIKQLKQQLGASE